MRSHDHFQALIALFNAAPINQKIYESSRLEISEGKAEYFLSIESQYFHGGGALHGSVYFKMLDDSAYFAAASHEKEFFMVTKSYEIDFLRPVKVERLKAIAEVQNEQGREITVEARLFNEQEKLVGKGRGVFVPTSMRLEDLDDYQLKG